MNPEAVQPPGIPAVQLGHRLATVAGGYLDNQISLLTGKPVINTDYRHLNVPPLYVLRRQAAERFSPAEFLPLPPGNPGILPTRLAASPEA
jgi:hypothetical protein